MGSSRLYRITVGGGDFDSLQKISACVFYLFLGIPNNEASFDLDWAKLNHFKKLYAFYCHNAVGFIVVGITWMLHNFFYQ